MMEYFGVITIYATTTALHYLLPAKSVSGYCCDCDSFKPLQYRLNGVFVLFSIIVLYLLLPQKVQTSLYDHYWVNLIAANVIGLSFSTLLFFNGGKEKYARCVTIDQLKDASTIQDADTLKRSWITTFFLGQVWNPRYFGIDIKMLLYLLGAVALQLNILSCVITHLQINNGHASNAIITYTICFTWFVFEYLMGEEVHLYTYDLFAEKMGFKLAWGCLVFYPFFYPIGAYSLVNNTAQYGDISVSLSLCIVGVFVSGWVITRGANMQKFAYRTNPTQKTFLFGLIPQTTIPGTRILCSGWWGVARHFNYSGEIIQALALSLPGLIIGPTIWQRCLPLLYPVYYIVLFVSRQMDDDEVCRRKYGDVCWDQYTKMVPYRILPGVW
mmetsp:Transcript_19755/g.27161  ORF Transcript_19755/g.27161 Transcript_19755/m.27161 type:complete len:384 (+) Transcript_19755:449-1600(+)